MRLTRSQAFSLLAITTATALVLETFVSVMRDVSYFDFGFANGLNFFAYFTAQSSVLALLFAVSAIRGWSGRATDVLRISALAATATTFVIHRVYLAQPFIDEPFYVILSDNLLHVIVPLLVWVLWAVYLLRFKVSWRLLLDGLIFPTFWITFTMVRGALTGFYPYAFFDPGQSSTGRIVVSILGSYVIYIIFMSLVWVLESKRESRRATSS